MTLDSPSSATASASCRSPSACSASPSSRSRSASRRTAACSRSSSATCGRRAPRSAPAFRRCCAARRSARVLGVLPGGGAALSSFAAYAVEKKVSRTPERFGRGAIEGVAAPEAANNAGAQTSFIPLLTLGIPGNAIMALMVGAMMIQGIQPGPQVMTKQPQLFWGVDRLDVARQPDADRAQPAADRPVGVAAARALPADVSGDRAVLLHRHLLGQQQRVRRLGDAAVRRARRLLLQGRRRAGAVRARLRARAR